MVACFYKEFGEEASNMTSKHTEQIDMMECEPSGISKSIVEKEPSSQLQSPDQFQQLESNENYESITQLKSSQQLQIELTDESSTTDSNHLETATQQNDEMPKKKVRNIYKIIYAFFCKQRKLLFPLEAMKVRANLRHLENLTYQLLDDQADMLKNLNSKVQDLYTDFCSLLPQKASLVLRPKGSQSVVIMRRKI